MPNSEDHAQKDAYRTAVSPSNRPPFGRRRERKLYCFAFPVNASPPPILVSFASVDALLDALPDQTRVECEQEIRRLVASGLAPATSTITVSTLFGVSSEFIGAMSRAPQRYYRRFTIRKGKKSRQIFAPKIALKLVQRWIGAHLARATSFPEYVYGFVPGRSGVIEAAQSHCGAQWVYSLDLRDFFPSIDSSRVIAALIARGYSHRAARLITRLCCLDGRLPQGSPASPVLSNLVFLEADKSLELIATAAGVRYSRYADDLVFSGQGDIPVDLVSKVKDVLSEHRWEIAPEKEHLAALPARLKVHGLLVNGEKPRLTKGYRNRIRAFRYLVASERVAEQDVSRINGHISYADHVEKARNR